MYAESGHRRVRIWRTDDRRSTVTDGSAMHSRPWMRGYPVPAWFETDSDSAG
jgi:hypothetical protein